MIEILYRTDTPEYGKSECYVLVLAPRAATGGNAYVFMEEHGCWDEDLQRFLYRANSIGAEEKLSFQDAWSMYSSAKGYLASQGFIHSVFLSGSDKEPATVADRQPSST